MSTYARVALVAVLTAGGAVFGGFCVLVMAADPDPGTSITTGDLVAALVACGVVLVGAVLTALVAGILALAHRGEHPTPTSPPAWYADPLGRHRRRYWDGRSWTTWAEDDGEALSDPVGFGVAPPR